MSRYSDREPGETQDQWSGNASALTPSSTSPVPYQGNRFNFTSYLLGVLTTLLLAIAGGVTYFLILHRPQPVATTPTGPEAATNSAPASIVTEPAPTNSPMAAPATSGITAPAAAPANTAPAPTTTTGTPTALAQPLQVRNQNGVILEVRGVTFGADNSILVDTSIINGSNIKINLSGAVDPLTLSDNAGHRYAFIEPQENPYLALNPGASLKGQLAFRGPLMAGANTLTLTTNAKKNNPDPDSRWNPTLSVNIPLQ